MKGLRERIHWQSTVGDKLTIGGAAITPQAQALVVRTPFGGWVWNRPVAIVVEQGGSTKRIPIVDVTRIVQLSFMGLGLLLSLISIIRMIRERRNTNG